VYLKVHAGHESIKEMPPTVVRRVAGQNGTTGEWIFSLLFKSDKLKLKLPPLGASIPTPYLANLIIERTG